MLVLIPLRLAIEGKVPSPRLTSVAPTILSHNANSVSYLGGARESTAPRSGASELCTLQLYKPNAKATPTLPLTLRSSRAGRRLDW